MNMMRTSFENMNNLHLAVRLIGCLIKSVYKQLKKRLKAETALQA